MSENNNENNNNIVAQLQDGNISGDLTSILQVLVNEQKKLQEEGEKKLGTLPKILGTFMRHKKIIFQLCMDLWHPDEKSGVISEEVYESFMEEIAAGVTGNLNGFEIEGAVYPFIMTIPKSDNAPTKSTRKISESINYYSGFDKDYIFWTLEQADKYPFLKKIPYMIVTLGGNKEDVEEVGGDSIDNPDDTPTYTTPDNDPGLREVKVKLLSDEGKNALLNKLQDPATLLSLSSLMESFDIHITPTMPRLKYTYAARYLRALACVCKNKELLQELKQVKIITNFKCIEKYKFLISGVPTIAELFPVDKFAPADTVKSLFHTWYNDRSFLISTDSDIFERMKENA